jgi:hypothetical protein
MRGAKKNAPRAKVPHPALKDSAVLSRMGEEKNSAHRRENRTEFLAGQATPPGAAAFSRR